MRKTAWAFVLAMCPALMLRANNARIDNISFNGNQVSFNLSWDNSWNASNNVDPNYPGNWDAVWIFVKVQSNATNLWYHQALSPTGNSVSSGTDGAALTLEAPSDNVGVFVRRSNAGHGNIVNAPVTLQLGTLPAGGSYNVKVFGIEMVKIPAGSFYLSDGVATSANYPRFNSVTVDNTAQTSGLAAGALFAGAPALAATWPMGYHAFYAQKYETTNDQLADFYNTLTYDQQALYFTAAPNAAAGTTIKAQPAGGYTLHSYLRIQTPGVNNTTPAVIGCDLNGNGNFNENADGNTVAAGLMRADEILAYLDWSGLRPMTETEFEKICRGTQYNGTPNPRVADEYPWGTTDIVNYTYSTAGITDVHMPAMRYVGTVVNGRGLYQQGGVAANLCPFRVGMFAEGATGRAASGSGFYGNMNLGDNVGEFVVGVSANTTSFTAQPGDGMLDNNAAMNQSSWPAIGTAGAYGRRGASFASSYVGGADQGTQLAKTSNRVYATFITAAGFNTPYAYLGFRGVR
jgi:formylglycine-generating enzyme required for sulfatase activity